MTFIQLTYLVALDEHRSYVQAAEACSVTQPALTLQIKNLEEELGIVLFDRTKKPIVPTSAGIALIGQARVILLEMKKAHDIAEKSKNTLEGLLTIGIIPTLAPYLLSLFLGDFQTQYPDIKLHIRELLTEDIVRELKNGHLDAGIFATPIGSKGLVFQPLFYEKFYLYVSPDHPLGKQKALPLANLPLDDLWILSEGNCFRNQVNDICHLHQGTNPSAPFTYQSHSIESLRRIVEYRNGITFIPELATLNVSPEKENMIIDIDERQPPIREISLAVTHTYVKKHLLDKLMASVLENIPPQMRQRPHYPVIDTAIKTG